MSLTPCHTALPAAPCTGDLAPSPRPRAMAGALALVFCVLALGAGCSEDAASARGQGDAGADASATTDVGALDAGRDVAAEPLDVGGDSGGGAPLADAGPATDVAVEPDVPSVPEREWPAVTPEACAFPGAPETCPQGSYGPGSFINSLQIVEDDSCCRDFNGDGRPDNYMGKIVGLARTLGLVDINRQIGLAIQYGLIVYLLEYSYLDHPEYVQNLGVKLYQGVDTDRDFTDNMYGFGDFLIKPESFDPLGNPLWQFPRGEVYDRQMKAEGGGINLFFPGLLEEVVLRTVDVRVSARLEPPVDTFAGGRVRLTGGEMSGSLSRDALFQSLNDATRNCECIGRDLFQREPTGRYSCRTTQGEHEACLVTDPDASGGCANLSDPSPVAMCNFLAGQSAAMDVDTDGDGVLDAYSFGARFEAVGARIVGQALTPQ